MMALFVVGIVSSGVYFISNKIITERKLSSQLRKDINANLALRSITDYIKYGIRKSWCFDGQLLPELPENCVNNFANQFSTARIMMPPSYAKTLEELGKSNPTEFPTLVGKKATDFMLQSFSIKLDITKLTMAVTHPLYRVLTNTRNPLVKGVNIRVSRIGNMTLPVNGDEVYIEIVTEFTDRDGQPLRTGIEVTEADGQIKATGKQFLRETASFVSNPRELNSFALILPGSIYLGETSAPIAGHGDMAIPKGSKSDVGMVFNSPVFVNQNIFMDSSGSYTPATFNDVVIIGNGKIKDHDGKDFKINEALGVKRYWTDLQTFGGFMRGIDSDGKGDAGLSVLNGVSDSTTLNNDIISMCINIVRAQGDLSITADSRLVGTPVSGSIATNLTETSIRYSFSTLPKSLDLFEPQEISENNGGINCNYNGLNSGNGGISCSGFIGSDFMDIGNKYNSSAGKDASNIWYSISPAYNLASGTELVMWANMTWPKSGNDDFLKIPILENDAGDGHAVTINFSAYSKNDFDQATNALAAVSSTLSTYTGSVSAASATLNTRTVRLALLETQKPASGGAYASWTDRGEYEDLKADKFNNDSVAWAQKKLDDSEQTYKDYFDNDYTPVEAEYNLRKEYYQNPGQIQISSTRPTNGFSERQTAFRNVTIKVLNGKYFKRASISPTNRLYNASGSGNDLYKTNSLSTSAIKDFSLEGMDYSGKQGGYSVRPHDLSNNITNNPNDGNTGKLADMNNVHYAFSINASDELVFSNRGLDYQGNEINLATYKPLDPTINYEEKVKQCMDSAGGTNIDAFKPASFASADFTSVATDSWHFAAPDKNAYSDQIFSTNVYSTFDIGSIRGNCTIESSVTVINGFYVCRSLEIKARSQPLKIIGTFMVLKDFIIDKTALRAGVTWQSIHNQNAVATMKSAGSPPLMRRADSTNCSSLYSGAVPFWHPDPGLQILSDRIRCSSTFLLQGKGPPRWTSVDPDCGRIGNSANTQCLKRIRNFNLIQLERVYGF